MKTLALAAVSAYAVWLVYDRYRASVAWDEERRQRDADRAELLHRLRELEFVSQSWFRSGKTGAGKDVN